MDFDDIYKKPEEHIIKSTKGSCFGDKETIDGTLILTNLRIYLQINEEQKMNEILISDIKNVSIGGINVLRCELNNNERYNFLVTNIFSWYKAIKKVIKQKS